MKTMMQNHTSSIRTKKQDLDLGYNGHHLRGGAFLFRKRLRCFILAMDSQQALPALEDAELRVLVH